MRSWNGGFERWFTLDIYSHVMPNTQEGAAAMVDGVLRAAINKPADDVG
jgi:hypothetical protein